MTVPASGYLATDLVMMAKGAPAGEFGHGSMQPVGEIDRSVARGDRTERDDLGSFFGRTLRAAGFMSLTGQQAGVLRRRRFACVALAAREVGSIG
jgi:hypothetical protein